MKIGIFQDTDEVYHAQEHIGSTSLKQMAISPAHFMAAWKGPKKDSKAYDEGKAVHSVLLEQKLDNFVRRPDGIDGRTKEGKEKLKELEALNKIILPGEVYDSMYSRLTTFTASQEAMRCYNGADIEKSYYAQDKETGLFIKARPDIHKAGVISDIKSTQNMATFEKQIWSLGYYIQAGFYSLVTEMVTGTEVREFRFIAQEKSAPYGVKTFYLSQGDLNWCKDRARELLNSVAACQQENKFPSYDDVAKKLEIPPWVLADGFTFEVAI